MEIINYISPELLILVPVLLIFGKIIKSTDYIKDKFIPAVLGIAGIVLAVVWVLATSSVATYQDGLTAAFTAVVQGVLCAGAAVYGNQIVKQGGKHE